MDAPDLHDIRITGDRIEQMLDDLEARADPATFGQAQEILHLVADLYGAGLTRVVQLAREHAPGLLEAMVADDLVASLLLVHGLHPDPLVSRVEAALASVRPLLAAHGGDVELLGVDESQGAVRLRLLGSCDGCPSSAVTLRSAVERSILEGAPEILTIELDEPSETQGAEIPVALRVKPAGTAVYAECPAEMATT